MAYIYDEKTGEFINTSAPKPTVRRTVQTSSTTRTTTTRTTTSGTSTSSRSSSRSSSSGIGDFFSGILVLVLHAIPYLIIFGLAALCS